MVSLGPVVRDGAGRCRRCFKVTMTCALAVSVVLGTRPALAAGLIRDAETESLIRDYAKPIFNAAGLGSHGVKIHLINSRSFNAFVVDGQNMFFHVGTLMKSSTPNQVIGVLAHETGHISGGHLSRLRQAVAGARSASLMLQIIGLAAMALGAASGSGSAGQIGMGTLYGGQAAAMRTILAYRRAEESSADQAALSFLNATKQSARGMLQTFQFFANQGMTSLSNVDPYLQSHPMPQQRIVQLRQLARTSPYFDRRDPPELQLRHDLMRAKLTGFLDNPRTVYNKYPQNDQSLPARYARAIATYKRSGVRPFLPKIDALIAAHPNNPYFLEVKGQFLFESGKARQAIPSLRKAVDLAPREGLIRIMLAQAMLAGGQKADVDPAIKHLRKALVRENTSALGYRQLASAYAKKRKISLAELASAQAYFYEGDLKLAKIQAKRAKAKFRPGTPSWIKADDILSFQPPKKR